MLFGRGVCCALFVCMMRRFLLTLTVCLQALPAMATEMPVSEAWLRLLHYQKTGVEYKSLVENRDFFISANGRNAPVDEYLTTIKTFNSEHDKRRCDFPARFMLLQKEGKVSGTLAECTAYQNFWKMCSPRP